MIRSEWLTQATSQLTHAGIDSARLDSELLLTHALGISRTTLHAHPEDSLPTNLEPILEAMLSLRVIRVPIAYIVGHREFYGRLFKVTPSVLIPRPETEDIVSIMTDLPAAHTIIDVGTGSGALAVTLALEYPTALVIGVDICPRALAVARQNAQNYNADVKFMKSDLLQDVSIIEHSTDGAPIIIVANLPYVDTNDERSPETEHEPAEALFAHNQGLELIYNLIEQASLVLQSKDYLLLESNLSQQAAIATKANENGFALEQTRNLISVLRRR